MNNLKYIILSYKREKKSKKYLCKFYSIIRQGDENMSSIVLVAAAILYLLILIAIILRNNSLASRV